MTYLTGLRRAAIASLTPVSFDLEADPATLTIEAQNSKHLRKDILSLHPHAPLWECLRTEPCGETCHLPSSAGNKVITAWPMLSADLRKAILAIVRSAEVMAEASLAATE